MLRKTLLFIAGFVAVGLIIVTPLFLIKTGQFKTMGDAAAAMVPPPTVVTAVPAKADS